MGTLERIMDVNDCVEEELFDNNKQNGCKPGRYFAPMYNILKYKPFSMSFIHVSSVI